MGESAPLPTPTASEGPALAQAQEIVPGLPLADTYAPPSVDQTEKPEAQRSCPGCGAPVARTAKVCTLCGAAIPRGETAQTHSASHWLQRVWVALIAVVAFSLVGTGAMVTRAYWANRPTQAPTPTQTATRTVALAAQAHTPTTIPTATQTSTATPTQTATATATRTATPTQAPTATPIVHIVQPGDTLYSIARAYGVTVEELAQANNLSAEGYVHPNDQLVIPAQGQVPGPTRPAAGVLHEVLQGEQLKDIAQRYGVSEERIREANSLEAEVQPKPGDQLMIPFNPTPTLTATATSTPTATPGPPYAAPQLLYPLDGAVFEGRDTVVLLQWASVGILQENEWYALQVRYRGRSLASRPSEDTTYAQITSWRVPADMYPGAGAAESGFEWSVVVVRKVDPDKPPEVICPVGPVRTFIWR